MNENQSNQRGLEANDLSTAQKTAQKTTQKTTQKNEAAIRISRMKLLALLASFLVPLILAASWLFYVKSTGGEMGISARGQLIRPAVHLEPFKLAEQGAHTFDQESIRGIWTLFYAPVGECEAVCQKNIYHMRQIRLSLVQRMTRLQRALILEEESQVDEELIAQHPGLRVIVGDRESVMGQVRVAEGDMAVLQDALYLIDPFGNLMMRFPADLNPKSILKDIKHLLKVSRIG